MDRSNEASDLILVVLPETAASVELRTLLDGIGANAVFAADYRSAMEIFENFKPGLVLVDADAEGGGLWEEGFGACALLSRHPLLSRVPLLLLSSGMLPEQLDRAVHFGVSDVILKPFLPAQLRNRFAWWFAVARNGERMEKARMTMGSIAFENSMLGMMIIGKDFRVIDSNPALSRLLGYEPGELRGQAYHEFTHPEDLYIDQDLFLEVVAGKRDGYHVDKRYRHKDGQWVAVRIHGSFVRNHRGDPEYAVAVIDHHLHRQDEGTD